MKSYELKSKGVSEKYSDAVARLNSPGDYVLVVRGVPRSVVMVCPDGCGENLTVNLDRRIGKAWRKYETDGKLTLYPSVWRDTGCRAHFIVWKDHILWCGENNPRRTRIDESLIDIVFRKLPSAEAISYEKIAEESQLIPWDVLWACRELTYRKSAIEEQEGMFKKIAGDSVKTKSSNRIDISV